MAFDPGAIGRAFSEHRFDEALGHLAKNVRWTIVGYMVLEGADAVRQTCRETAASLEDTTTTYDRCVVAAGSDVVAVDTFARYQRPVRAHRGGQLRHLRVRRRGDHRDHVLCGRGRPRVGRLAAAAESVTQAE